MEEGILSSNELICLAAETILKKMTGTVESKKIWYHYYDCAEEGNENAFFSLKLFFYFTNLVTNVSFDQFKTTL